MVQAPRFEDMRRVLKKNFETFVKDYNNNKDGDNIFFKVYKEDGFEVPVYSEYDTKVIKYDRWV